MVERGDKEGGARRCGPKITPRRLNGGFKLIWLRGKNTTFAEQWSCGAVTAHFRHLEIESRSLRSANPPRQSIKPCIRPPSTPGVRERGVIEAQRISRKASLFSSPEAMANSRRSSLRLKLLRILTLSQPLTEGWFIGPGRSTVDDGVGVDEELSCTGGERQFVRFSGAGKAGVKSHQRLVPTKGCWQGGSVEGAAQSRASADDVALPLVLSAVVVERCEAGQRGGLLAADASEFRHADDEGDRGPLADTGDAKDEIEAQSEIIVDAQPLGDAPLLQTGNVVGDEAAETAVMDVLEPDLEARDILFQLFDEGQRPRQIRQARVGFDLRRIEICRAGGDERGIEHVVLGAAQAEPEPPSNWWTPLLSSVRSRKVFDDKSASEFHG